MGMFNSKVAQNLKSLTVLKSGNRFRNSVSSSGTKKIILFGEVHTSDEHDYLELFNSYDFTNYSCYAEAYPTGSSETFKSGCHSSKTHLLDKHFKNLIYTDLIRSHPYINVLLMFCNSLLVEYAIKKETENCSPEEAKCLSSTNTDNLEYAEMFRNVIGSSDYVENAFSASLLLRMLPMLNDNNDVYSELIFRLAQFNDAESKFDTSVIQNIDNAFTKMLEILKAHNIDSIELLKLYRKELKDLYIVMSDMIQTGYVKTDRSYELLTNLEKLNIFDDVDRPITLSFNDCLLFDVEFLSKYLSKPNNAVLLCGDRHVRSIVEILKLCDFEIVVNEKINGEIPLYQLYHLCN